MLTVVAAVGRSCSAGNKADVIVVGEYSIIEPGIRMAIKVVDVITGTFTQYFVKKITLSPNIPMN